MSAYNYLHDLQTRIGERLPGSENETRAIDWLGEKLQAFGLKPEREAFTYQPATVLSLVFDLITAAGVIALGLASAMINPLLVIAGMALVLIFNDKVGPVLRQKTGKTTGHNIIAGVTRPWAEVRDGTERRPLVLVCAHYDTARGLPAWLHKLFQFEETIFGAGLIGLALLMAYCVIAGVLWLFHLFGIELAVRAALANVWRIYGTGLFFALALPGTLFLIAAIVPHLFKTMRPQNPGADDNGSGVATALAVVENLASRTDIAWDVVVAFWGAEEVGLIGSRRFVEKHKYKLDPHHTVIVNLDGVGRGRCLGVITGQGIVWRKAVDEELVQRWEEACASAGVNTIRFWMTSLSGATDQAAWLAAKFTQALSIGCGDPMKIPLMLRICYRLLNIPSGIYDFRYDYIHSPADSLDSIRPESLDMTTRVVSTFVERLAMKKGEQERIVAPRL